MGVLKKYLAGFLFSLLFLAFAGGALAAPAFWRVEGEGGTLYVLGTMHRLPEDSGWFTPGMQEAAGASRAMVLEIKSSQAGADYLGYLTRQTGLVTSKKHLSGLIGEDSYQLYQATLETFGVSSENISHYRPWYAAIMIGRLAGEQAGYYESFGAESVLEGFSRANGIPVIGLETVQQQFLFLAGLPEQSEVSFLQTALREGRDYQQSYDALYHAWMTGDTAASEDIVLKPLKEDRALYETLILNRNRAWARQLEDLLEPGATYFVAVGAAHLVGPDSVLKMLEDKGYQVTRQ